MINTEVLEQRVDHAHIVFRYDNELSEVYEKACEYQQLVLEYKLYKDCWVIVEPNIVHCIANNTGKIAYGTNWLRLQVD
jgi:hypothetical protein